jgi:hypothetical protein
MIPMFNYLTKTTLPLMKYPATPSFSLFDNALDATDGTQISCLPSSEEWESSHNCKGSITQNVLACCSFVLRFQYFLSGANGASSDATLFINAHTSDLRVPLGRYYLADAGFAACDSLIIPYRHVCYHLAEWGCADLR